MKIVIINTIYGYGSTGKLTRSFVRHAMENGHEIYVIFADGTIEEPINSLKIKNWFTRKVTILAERLSGLTGCFSPIATRQAIEFIDKIQPDIIYLGNLHGFYINIYELCRKIGNKNIPCVQIMWDEFSMTGGCAFSFECDRFKKECYNCVRLRDYPQSYFFDQTRRLQEKKKEAYSYGNMAFVSVPYTISRAKESTILRNQKLIELDEAVDQKTIFYPKDSSELRKKLGISEDTIIILNVCVYPNERKGGQYYIELAQKCKDISGIVFIHVGFNGRKEECPKNYIPIGFVKDQDALSEFYSLADLFVCTSLAETQPNTCLEALSCGTPICGFNISGVPTCADVPFGHYVEFADVDALRNIVINAKKKTDNNIKNIRHYAETRFSSQDYNDRLLDVGENLIRELQSK